MKPNHNEAVKSAIKTMSDEEFRATVFIAKLTDPDFANAYFKKHKLGGTPPKHARK